MRNIDLFVEYDILAQFFIFSIETVSLSVQLVPLAESQAGKVGESDVLPPLIPTRYRILRQITSVGLNASS